MVAATAEQRRSSLTAPVHATLAKFSTTMSISDDTGKLLFFVQVDFIMLPTRPQHASGAPIDRQRWCNLAACHVDRGARDRLGPSRLKYGFTSMDPLTADESSSRLRGSMYTNLPTTPLNNKVANPPGSTVHASTGERGDLFRDRTMVCQRGPPPSATRRRA